MLPERFQRLFVDSLVHWASPVNDGYGGVNYSTVEELKGRWVQKGELFLDTNGERQLSNAVVYLKDSIVAGDWLYLGGSSDLDSGEQASPETVSGAWRVRRVDPIRGIVRGPVIKVYL